MTGKQVGSIPAVAKDPHVTRGETCVTRGPRSIRVEGWGGLSVGPRFDPTRHFGGGPYFAGFRMSVVWPGLCYPERRPVTSANARCPDKSIS